MLFTINKGGQLKPNVVVKTGYYRGMEGVAQEHLFRGIGKAYEVVATNTSPSELTRFWRAGIVYTIYEDMLEWID